jgi:hypothetical protein
MLWLGLQIAIIAEWQYVDLPPFSDRGSGQQENASPYNPIGRIELDVEDAEAEHVQGRVDENEVL